MSNSSEASKRAAKAQRQSASKGDRQTARLRDFIIWRRIGASPAPTITATAEGGPWDLAPLAAVGPPISKGERSEDKRKGQFYTRPDLAKRYLRRFEKHFDLADFQIVEPGAGRGAFLNVLPFGSFGCDIEVRCEGVFLADFLTLDINSNRPIACVGNPPFGKNAKLAIRFFNHAASFSEVIAFILPRTFRKASTINGLDDRFHLLHEELVPANAFVFEGRPHSVPTVFQIWVRRDDRRAPIPQIRTHKDFDFVSGPKADFAIQRVGKNAGRVHRDLEGSPDTNYFIKGNVKGVMRKLRHAFAKVAADTAGQPSLSKAELVSIYSSWNSHRSRGSAVG